MLKSKIVEYMDRKLEQSMSEEPAVEVRQAFFFTTKGELVLELKYDTGTTTFR